MLPQVNDGCRLPAAFIHHESDSTHETIWQKRRGSKFKTFVGTLADFENLFQSL
jgi:hypothetical protein